MNLRFENLLRSRDAPLYAPIHFLDAFNQLTPIRSVILFGSQAPRETRMELLPTRPLAGQIQPTKCQAQATYRNAPNGE